MPSLAAQPAATKNLTKREVIEALGKSKRTIETYIKDGRLACTYINGRNGRQALFDADAVAALKREIDTPAEKPAAPRIVPAAEKPAKTQPPDGAQFTLADVSRVVAALKLRNSPDCRKRGCLPWRASGIRRARRIVRTAIRTAPSWRSTSAAKRAPRGGLTARRWRNSLSAAHARFTFFALTQRTRSQASVFS